MSPCQGESRGSESRLPLHKIVTDGHHPKVTIWHHSQEVRQGSAKSSPPVQVWVMPPKNSISQEVLFFIISGDGIRLHGVKSAVCADPRGFVPQGRHRRWPHRLPLHKIVTDGHHPKVTIWHHSQEVRQGSAKSSPPVQVWVMPPKNKRRYCRLFLFTNLKPCVTITLAKYL